MGANALSLSGNKDRAREWMRRALLLDPDNLSMRYNVACSLALDLDDPDGALDALQPYFERVQSRTHIRHLEADPDFDRIRDDPRFKEKLAAAKKRLGMEPATQAQTAVATPPIQA
jgi:adenylate cyclase